MPAGRPRKNKDDVLMKSAEMLGWALGGLEREITQTRERLANLTQQAATLRARVGGAKPAATAPGATAAPAAGGRKRKRRKLSREARKRIADNLRKRWAEAKKAGKTRLQPAR